MGSSRFDRRAGNRIAWAAFAVGMLSLTSCATIDWPWAGNTNKTSPKADAKNSATATPPPKSSAGPPGTQADAQSLQEVMSELQQVGAGDPAAREELMTDLKKVDPNLWPMVLQSFKAQLAYKRREGEREAENRKQELALDNTPRQSQDTKILGPALPETRFELKQPEVEPAVGSATASAADRSQTRSPAAPAAMEKSGEGIKINTLSPTPADDSGLAITSPAIAPEPPATSATGASAIEPLPAAAMLASTRAEASSGTASFGTGAAGNSAGQNFAASPKSAAGPAEAELQSHLAAAIQSIEAGSKAGSKNDSDIALQARLRMLYLLAGRRDDAMRPLPSAPQASQDYWKSQIYGLSTWMDAEKTPDSARRAAETKRILSDALAQLGETAPLAVRNLTFCTEVFRFGAFDAAKNTDFTPGQKVLLYAELDNLHTESSPKGYHWAVKISGQIFDNRGGLMADCGSSTAEEFYQTPRRDYFVSKLYYLPRLLPGRYTLQLTIEDTLGHKVGQSSVDFTIKPQG